MSNEVRDSWSGSGVGRTGERRIGILLPGLALVAGLAAVFLAMAVAGGSEASALDAGRVSDKARAVLAAHPALQVEARTQERGGISITEWWSADSPMYRVDERNPGADRSVAVSSGRLTVRSNDTGFVTSRDLGGAAARGLHAGPLARYWSVLQKGRPMSARIVGAGSRREAVRLELEPSLSEQPPAGAGRKRPIVRLLLDRETYLPSEYVVEGAERSGDVYELQVRPIAVSDLRAAVTAVSSEGPGERYEGLSLRQARDYREHGLFWFGPAAAGLPLRGIYEWTLTAEGEPRQRVVSFSYERPGSRFSEDPVTVENRPSSSPVARELLSHARDEGARMETPAGPAFVFADPAGARRAVVAAGGALVEVRVQPAGGGLPELRALLSRLRRVN